MNDRSHDDATEPTRDFSRFLRIPEGHCELLSARYSNQHFGRHSHDRYAFGVITQGVEKLYYRGGHHFGTAGTVVTLSPGEIHDGIPVDKAGWVYRMLYIEPNWLNEVVLSGRVAASHLHLFHQPMASDPALAATFLGAHRIASQSSSSLERESVLVEMLATLFQRHGLALAGLGRGERDAVRRIKQRLDDEAEQNLSLETLGAEAGMDPLYLIRVFKREVGVAPHSYQIQRRVARVQAFLRAGMELADAAVACGFFDQSHMARAFKKVVGITPASFRNSLGR
ncbi:MAG: AraC family transcriptional regulator [Paucimonas sp.]|jgi:AraC-like DNA-binding protein|nr:AraC family transcriptional regulator [Paucimonas sp.]